jgi:hypothetical protein
MMMRALVAQFLALAEKQGAIMPLVVGHRIIGRPRSGIVIRAFDRPRMLTAFGRADALWCIAEAGTERPVEAGNIEKAGLQCDVKIHNLRSS